MNGLVVVLVLTPIAALVASLTWGSHLRRTVAAGDLVRSVTLDDGKAATALVPPVGKVPATVLCFGFGLPMVVGGLLLLPSYAGLGVPVLLLGAYLLAAGFLVTSGRMGDGAIWFTVDGVTQHSRGLEQSVRWAEVDRVGKVRFGLGLHSAGGPRSRRSAPWLWTGRGRPGANLMTLLLDDIHPDLAAVYSAVPRWATDEFARLEIGTAEASARLLCRAR